MCTYVCAPWSNNLFLTGTEKGHVRPGTGHGRKQEVLKNIMSLGTLEAA